MMTEAINIMLGLSVVLSLTAAAAWMKVSRAGALQSLDRGAVAQGSDGEIASQLLILTVVTSAFAAAFAVIGMF
jgi:hypothetical protein